MKGLNMFRAVLVAAILLIGLGGSLRAADAAGPTPQQIQTMIVSGHADAALADLRVALREHPRSGVAWFLKAEAEDAKGRIAAARDALDRAERYAPGLPFADPGRVAALKAHLAAPPPARRGAGGLLTHPAVLILGGLVVLFLLMRWRNHNRRVTVQPPFPNNYGYGPNGAQPGAPPPPYGPGGGFAGGGLGSSLMTGLAAGAGFAAGERLFDGLAGGHGNAPPAAPGGADPLPPDRDDGLMGNPGWDDNGGLGDADTLGGGIDFDPGNDW